MFDKDKIQDWLKSDRKDLINKYYANANINKEKELDEYIEQLKEATEKFYIKGSNVIDRELKEAIESQIRNGLVDNTFYCRIKFCMKSLPEFNGFIKIIEEYKKDYTVTLVKGVECGNNIYNEVIKKNGKEFEAWFELMKETLNELSIENENLTIEERLDLAKNNKEYFNDAIKHEFNKNVIDLIIVFESKFTISELLSNINDVSSHKEEKIYNKSYYYPRDDEGEFNKEFLKILEMFNDAIKEREK